MKFNYTKPLSGNCPIQAEGLTSCGKPWYFRARQTISLTVGTGVGHPLENTLWEINEDDDGAPKFPSFAYPGWADYKDCEAWIIAALEIYEQRKQNG